MQELHPLAFGSFVPRLIAVAHEQVITRLEARPPGATDAGDNGGGDAAPADGGGDGSKYTVRLISSCETRCVAHRTTPAGACPTPLRPPPRVRRTLHRRHSRSSVSLLSGTACTTPCIPLFSNLTSCVAAGSRGLLLTAEDVSAFEAEPEGSVFEEGLVREASSPASSLASSQPPQHCPTDDPGTHPARQVDSLRKCELPARSPRW